MMRTVLPLAALNPRRYDRLRTRLQLSIREGSPIIQPIANKLRAVCFDLDWTLSFYPLSTRQVLEEALVRSSVPVERFGDLASAAERYNELWLELERSADSTDTLRSQIMTNLFEERGCHDMQNILQVSQAYDDVRRESGVAAYPGVDAFLADLKSNYKLGMYTNGPSFLQWEKIEALRFNQWFDAIIVAGDIDIYKPDSRAFASLSEALGVPASRTLFVGDSYEADIVGAHAAGMYTAWIKHEDDVEIDGALHSTPVKMGHVQPTFVISETSQLREVLL
jgi:HAD superfamily hydrolase (TIGR01549 family)